MIRNPARTNHFIFEINVGKSRIRHRTTLNLNELIFSRFRGDLEIQFQSRSMSGPPLSDIDFKNKIPENIPQQSNYYYLLNA